MRLLIIPFFAVLYCFAPAQSLDLGSSEAPMILPRLSSSQIQSVPSPALGMFVYNTDEHQMYSYMRYRTTNTHILSNNRWQPISTGPRMMSWGVVDSLLNNTIGSENFTIEWDAPNRWYKLGLTNPHEYYKDSMLLIITPVGNGTHDQMPATGEIIEGSSRFASIKFSDASRIADGFSTLESRRRSGFHFVLYDLRKSAY
ncbi:MAG: hypothetical protein IPL46_18065 [Saprospiraceae bacterium]|nr:hypothetical protein [Saprospiraceae bacterium]